MNLTERSRELGEYLGAKLRGLSSKHRCIGDVRGLGLFWAADLVRNRTTKKPFNTKTDKMAGKPLVVDKIVSAMMSKGVAVHAWLSHFVIAQPLIISKEEIDFGVRVLDEALAIADEQAEG